MRRLFITIILLCFTLPLFCQNDVHDTMQGVFRDSYQPKKVDWGFTLGTQFTSMSGYGSGLSTFITPHFSYSLNKRFRMGGGISIISTNYQNARSFFPMEQCAGSNGNFTNAEVFVNGQYLFNDRITISGSAYKEFPIAKDPLPYNPFNPVARNGAHGVNFNVDYKIGEHMHIQAGFGYSQDAHSFYTNPFYTDPLLK